MSAVSRLGRQISEVTALLRRIDSPFALIGGLALASHNVIRATQDVDLLVCEGTFASDQDQPRAVERKHMTFGEAATLARQAGARKLLLTHFSPTVTAPEDFADHARAIFADTIVGQDHLTLELKYSD